MVAKEKGLGWLGPEQSGKSSAGVEPKPAGEPVEGGREGYRNAHEQLLPYMV